MVPFSTTNATETLGNQSQFSPGPVRDGASGCPSPQALQANVAQYQSNLQCFKSNGVEAPDFPISLKVKRKGNKIFDL